MIIIPGYTPHHQIYKSKRTQVYRAKDENGLPVVLKIRNKRSANPEDCIQLMYEYRFLSELDTAGLITPYELISLDNHLIMAMEDFGGDSLTRLKVSSGWSPDLKQWLQLAIGICNVLELQHNLGIIHKHITPANIVWNPETDEIKFIDFGIATRVPCEHIVFSSPQSLEGTLAYLAPEQTGRTNHPVDYRADFYSLGVTLYELLTNRLPFVEKGYMLVYAHIVGKPVPPNMLNPAIPEPISEIICRLLAKHPEDRYQSVKGIVHDLKRSLDQLLSEKRIQSFRIGQGDIHTRFPPPKHFLTKGTEVEALFASFGRISRGGSGMVIISGETGLGKSAMAREVLKPLTRKHGFFISGTFENDRFQHPYEGFTHAFKELIQQISSQSKKQIQNWKAKILETLKNNGQIIIDLVPELEQIIGPQPRVPELSPTENEKRFHYVFTKFLSVFADASHPLVILIKDIQWAPLPSLQMIKRIMTHPEINNLLILVTCHDTENLTNEKIIAEILELQNLGYPITNIHASALRLPEMEQLIMDILGCSPEVADQLAPVCMLACQGKPFFIGVFLQYLYQKNWLTLTKGKEWSYTNSRETTTRPLNVPRLLLNMFNEMSVPVKQILQLASMISRNFSIDVLTKLTGMPPEQIGNLLLEPIERQLVIPVSPYYKYITLSSDLTTNTFIGKAQYTFASESIRQIIQSTIAESEHATMHLKIGQVYLEQGQDAVNPSTLFLIASHLNRCIPYESRDMKLNMAEINYRAGRNALTMAAHEPALNFFQAGIDLLPDDSWERHYQLSFDLYSQAMAVAGLVGEFDRMEQLASIVESRATTVADKVRLLELKLQCFQFLNKPETAIEQARYALALLDVNLGESLQGERRKEAVEQVLARMGGRSPLELKDLPDMQEPSAKAILRICTGIAQSVYHSKPELIPQLAVICVDVSLTHGNSQESAFGYALFGAVLCEMADHMDIGYEFGRLALFMAEPADQHPQGVVINVVVYSRIHHWKQPCNLALSPLLDAWETGCQVGNFSWAVDAAHAYCCHAFFMSRGLNSLKQKMVTLQESIQRLGDPDSCSFRMNQILVQTVLNLLSPTGNPCFLRGQAFDENRFATTQSDHLTSAERFLFYLNKMILAYWFSEFDLAAKMARQAATYIESVNGLIHQAVFCFFDSMIHLAFGDNEIEIYQRVSKNQQCLKSWATHAPMNFLHRFYLVEAERSRMIGKDGDAREYYDRAIQLAQKNQYIHDEALANELAGRFYLAKSMSKFARIYLNDARSLWQLWGATTKVDDMESRYSDQLDIYIGMTAIQYENAQSEILTPVPDAWDTIDVMLTLSGEREMARFLEKAIENLFEISRANKIVILMPCPDGWCIAAWGRVNSQDVPVISTEFHTSNWYEGPIKIPKTIIHHVAEKRHTVMLTNAGKETLFDKDPYITSQKNLSVLCVPVFFKHEIIGIIYLETNRAQNSFSSSIVKVIETLAIQMGISIENIQRYTLKREQSAEQSKQLDEIQTELDHQLKAKDNLEAMITKYQNGIQSTLDRTLSLEHRIYDAYTVLSEKDGHVKDLPKILAVNFQEILQDLMHLKHQTQHLKQLIRNINDLDNKAEK